MKIFAIEFTNWCNAKCGFCPYPTPAHNREKGYMTRQTLERIVEVISEPRAINISGLGEPLLHPGRVEFVKYLTDHGIKVQINTNGQPLTQDLYNQLADSGCCRVVITSDYFPWKHGWLSVQDRCPVVLQTITREPDFPELGQVRKPLDDWGGQVGKVERPTVDCTYLKDDFVLIYWDGSIVRCCVDFNANHVLGNIHTWTGASWVNCGIPLCNGCHGYVFKDGIVVGDFEGAGVQPPSAFLKIE